MHKGFYDTWLSLRNSTLSSFIDLFTTYNDDLNQILITGHSLGAAQAQLAALEIREYLGDQNITIFMETFGSPRWGNKVMAEYAKNSINIHWRLVNVRDIVPTYPLQVWAKQHSPFFVYNLKRERCPAPFHAASGIYTKFLLQAT